MSFSLGEYQDIFLEEADDQLQELNKNLLELESNPNDEGIINNIFRAAHSLKSSAAFVGLNELSELSHKMENLLQGIRDKTMAITPEIIDILFKSFDFINSVIEAVSEGEKPDQDLSGIIEQITAISEDARESGPEETTAEPVEKSNEFVVPKTTFTSEDAKILKNGTQSDKKGYELTIFIVPDAPMKWVKAQLIINNIKSIGQIVKTFPAEENLTDDEIGGAFKIIILTGSNIDAIRRACDVDLVVAIEIARIEFIKENGKNILKFSGRKKYEEETEELAELPEEVPEIKEDKPPAAPAMDIQMEEEAAESNDSNDIEEMEEDSGETLETKESAEKTKKASTNGRKAPSLKSVKVSVEKLDELLNTVGELVIANSGFYRLYDEIKHVESIKGVSNEFKSRMEQMSRIAKDLQSGIMKTRMVPIGQVFNRFNRLVRDLAKTVDKNVQLVIKGEDTELDKKVIDVINEPLMHLVRNSVDHGIESAEERLQLKKDEIGTVTLNAFQGGNQIYVEVTDDGKGLNVETIKRIALEKGLTTPEMVANMDEADIFQFIFHPGFSTADKITDISGRGVGMNVVKEVANEMNGSVNIESEPGMGTVFTMSFPLTLAIIPAIMVKVQTETYAVPLSDVIETIKISYQDITTIEGHEVINLRGEILSLLRLNEFVGIRSGLKDNTKVPVVVVGYGNRKIGLIVDELEGKLEIVIKSLEQNYKSVEGLAGASILGDGSICLILDISSMITKVITEQEKLAREGRNKLQDRYEELSLSIPEVGAKEAEVKEVKKQPQKEKPVYEEKPAASPEKVKEPEPEKENDDLFLDEPEIDASTGRFVEEPEPVSYRKEEESASPVKDESIESTIDSFATKVETEDSINIGSEPEEPSGEQSTFAMDAMEDNSKPEEEPVKFEEEVTKEPAVEQEEEIQEDIIFDSQTQPVQEVMSGSEEVDEEVKNALKNFKEELESNISETLGKGGADQHMKESLDISEDELKKVQMLANAGITNAATSLSQIMSKRIDLSIPEVRLMSIEGIPHSIGGVNDVYLGVYMPISGDLKGTILFSLPEKSGFELICELYGLEPCETNELTEDGSSALKEITNIVGSSVINAFAEKTGLSIMPLVPTIVHDYMQSIMDSILIMHNIENDYALIMDTEFYYEDDRIMANLLIIPETESLKYLVKNQRGQ